LTIVIEVGLPITPFLCCLLILFRTVTLHTPGFSSSYGGLPVLNGDPLIGELHIFVRNIYLSKESLIPYYYFKIDRK
jgi:hypothetical protein